MTHVRTLFLMLICISNISAAHTLQGKVLSNDSPTYKGQILEVQGTYLLRQGLKLFIEDQNLTRTYLDNVQVTDNLLTFGTVWNTSTQTYLEAGLSGSSTANVFAKNIISATPHYVLGRSDFSLGLKYAEYKALKAGTVAPQYFYSITDRSGIGFGVFFVSTDKIISAAQVQGVIGILDRHSLRLGAAAGRAIEDAGLEADFKSASSEYSFQANPHWNFIFLLQSYWSNVRSEQTIGLGVGYR